MAIPVERKKRLAFSLVMGLITTGLISFALIAVNIGFAALFLKIWFKSWLIAYVVVIPAILFIAPPLQKTIDDYFDAKDE
jgi:Protein of unknown function (DUF2798).